MSKARQIFSIFHELAHLLRKSGGVDFLQETFSDRANPNYYLVEQKCNEFAGEFLFPTALFQTNIPPFNESNINKMADAFKVSREVILRKYLDTKIIDYKKYKAFTDKWLCEYFKSRQKKEGDEGGGNSHNTRKSYLGKYYIDLAFSHFYQGKIDSETLCGYLGINETALPAFEGYALR
jgi:Zn-dependent peptidase ImmA (M78 family)